MKTLSAGFGAAVVAALIAGAPAFAAANVTTGSIGQRTSDNATFGISVCNSGDAATSASLPISATVNGASLTVQSQTAIAPGSCAYSYFPYGALNMIGGKSYTVQVSVNDNTPLSYTVAVPGSVLGASISAGTTDQNRINVMATEVLVLHQLISLLQKSLGL